MSNVLAFLSISLCLGLAAKYYPYSINWPSDPPISGLAESEDGFKCFAAGFTLLCTFLAIALLLRAIRVGVTLTGAGFHCLNISWVVLSLIALPFILVMAFNRDDGPNGTLHFIAAGIGMGLICLAGGVHAVLCLIAWRHIDPSLPVALRIGTYVLQLVLLIIGAVSFGVWFMSDKYTSTLEWVGFIFVMAAYASYTIFYVAKPAQVATSSKEGREELLP